MGGSLKAGQWHWMLVTKEKPGAGLVDSRLLLHPQLHSSLDSSVICSLVPPGGLSYCSRVGTSFSAPCRAKDWVTVLGHMSERTALMKRRILEKKIFVLSLKQ